ncbi:MAG: MGMT family protein [Candidatus Woesearchaeota archaeon]
MEKRIRTPTVFEQEVYATISQIPKGSVMTYGELAKKLKSSPRAVGQALKRNPYAPKVPCHRVIKSDGSLGGYNGKMDSKKKILLLKNEGVVFENGKICHKTFK